MEYEVYVTVKIRVMANHETHAQRIAADKIRLAVSALRAGVVQTETK